VLVNTETSGKQVKVIAKYGTIFQIPESSVHNCTTLDLATTYGHWETFLQTLAQSDRAQQPTKQ
jgi:hypothetical protein